MLGCLDRMYHFLKLKKTYQMVEIKTANLATLILFLLKWSMFPIIFKTDLGKSNSNVSA